MKAFLLFLWLLIILIAGSMWNGYVFSVMWGWFVVPAFHLPQVSVAVAIGISMIVGMLTHHLSQDQEKKKSDTTDAMISSFSWSFLYPLLMLAAGYVAHLFV
jgi:predicted phage tail protein